MQGEQHLHRVGYRPVDVILELRRVVPPRAGDIRGRIAALRQTRDVSNGIVDCTEIDVEARQVPDPVELQALRARDSLAQRRQEVALAGNANELHDGIRGEDELFEVLEDHPGGVVGAGPEEKAAVIGVLVADREVHVEAETANAGAHPQQGGQGDHLAGVFDHHDVQLVGRAEVAPPGERPFPCQERVSSLRGGEHVVPHRSQRAELALVGDNPRRESPRRESRRDFAFPASVHDPGDRGGTPAPDEPRASPPLSLSYSQ